MFKVVLDVRAADLTVAVNAFDRAGFEEWAVWTAAQAPTTWEPTQICKSYHYMAEGW